MPKIFLSILLSILYSLGIHAQKLNVESFVVKTNDITARTQSRQDINGNDCALIKVQIAALDAIFSGTVVGDVSYNTSEYLVYMSHGSKRLTVKLEGYLPLEVKFEEYGIKALESKTTYVLTISGAFGARQQEAPRIKTGWIVLDSEPSGASVYINNEFVGNTPLNNYKQSYGTYQYRLEKPNYHPAVGTIELNAGRFEQRIALKPAFGSISVKSNVEGAKILVDGKPTGKNSPATLTEVPSGSHVITLQLDKYAPQQQNVVVEDGQIANVSMSLNARFASVTINSIEGADIYSNGKLIGHSHITEDMMEGYYDLEVCLDHYKSVTKQIQVIAGQPQDITLNPIPKYGSLDIVSTPHDATITIDGKVIGKTPFTMEKLLVGEHTVMISKEGYLVLRKVVVVAEDTIEYLSATLEEGMQYLNNDGESSIKLVGRLTDKEWSKLRKLLNDNKDIKSVDLSEAECSVIPQSAFANDSNLTSILLPNSVKKIESNAFRSCKGLTSIIIPSGVTIIGYRAFDDCINLTSITIPNSLTCIEYDVFRNTRWLDLQPTGLVYAGRVVYGYKGEMPRGTSITLKDGTTGIASGAFMLRLGLTAISIPESVTTIGSSAFWRCRSLASIKIPDSVTSIGDGAFENTRWFDSQPLGLVYAGRVVCGYKGEMPKGSSITLKDGTVSISSGAFEGLSGLATISIPESVTSIGNRAFFRCESLMSIKIPNSVTSIGEDAFRECISLTSANIPISIVCVEDRTFMNCKSLVSIKIPGSVTSIGSSAFYECKSLVSIIIPNSVTSIGESAFYGCKKLTSITIPNSVTSIGGRAFAGCSGLTSVTLPNSVASIGDAAFVDCYGLTSIKVESGNSKYDSRNNCNAIIETSSSKLILGCQNTVIPNSVTSIGERAFCGCSGLTSITIPQSVTSIGYAAFVDCYGLVSITIPDSVTSISDGAFNGCKTLRVYAPKSVSDLFKGTINLFYIKRIIELK